MRRWLLRTVAGVLLAAACVWLGMWQLDRNEQRQHRNALIEANIADAPVPVDEVLSPDHTVEAGDEWVRVVTSGHYDVDNEWVVRLRPMAGQSGVHVLTPLVTRSGAALLVDRGFYPAQGADVPEVPAPPAGEVEVMGRVRLSEERRGPGGDPASGAIRYVDVPALAAEAPYPLYGGWIELIEQTPAPADDLTLIPAPQIESGPHLSYAIQWFAFAVIGVGGFVLLIRAEAKARAEDAVARPSALTRQPAPPTDRQEV